MRLPRPGLFKRLSPRPRIQLFSNCCPPRTIGVLTHVVPELGERYCAEQARFAQFKDLPRDHPIQMLNPVPLHEPARYPDGRTTIGVQAYQRYGAASGQAFIDMIRDPGCRAAVGHRQAAVKTSRLIRMSPSDGPEGFA